MKTRINIALLIAAVFAVALIAGSRKGISQQGAAQQSAAIEPRASQILRKMSDYVAGLKQFSIQMENTLDVVLESGEKIQYDTPVEMSLRRPNKIRANRKGDILNQELFYDGRTLTLFQKGPPDYYATVKAPPTIEEALDMARESLDVYAPAGDLIYSNAYEALTEDVVSGSYVSLSIVDGIRCHHLAFRGNEVDWQIWIDDGDKPLPRKFIITSKWMTGAPQYTVLIKSWNLSPELTDDYFTFAPPKGAEKIDFIRLSKEITPQR